MTAKEAIARCMTHDEIVVFDATEDDHEVLRELCVGSVDVVKQYGWVDYWGGDEDCGTDWRVHARVREVA